jgi:hypothetical protein
MGECTARSTASQARIEANRSNARKSTGPVTEEGKNKVRLNAVKHGLRAVLPVLPGEDPEAIERCRRAWSEELAPRGPIAGNLLDAAVAAALGLERCRRHEAAALAEQAERAEAEEAAARTLDVEQWAQALPGRPGLARAGLAGSPEGASWVECRWERLAEQLERDGAWDAGFLVLALNLLGVRPHEVWEHSAAYRLARLALACRSWRGLEPAALAERLACLRPAGLSDEDFRARLAALMRNRPDAQLALSGLIGVVAHERAIWQEISATRQADMERRRARGADLAAVDVSAAGALRLRYMQMHQRALRHALEDLMSFGEPDAECHDPGPGPAWNEDDNEEAFHDDRDEDDEDDSDEDEPATDMDYGAIADPWRRREEAGLFEICQNEPISSVGAPIKANAGTGVVNGSTATGEGRGPAVRYAGDPRRARRRR